MAARTPQAESVQPAQLPSRRRKAMAPKTVNKSAKTGRFVKAAAVKKSPSTTFKETTKPSSKKGK
jgi:hypothetical protein